jgi:hypothetical protein
MKPLILAGLLLFALPASSQLTSWSSIDFTDGGKRPAPDYSKTGSVAADAKIIDATEIGNFQEGYAIVRKGDEFAIIDRNGEFFIPYGKYKFNVLGGFKLDATKCGFSRGMCAVRDVETEKYGFINYEGKLVIPCTLYDVSPFLKDNFAWAKERDAQGREIQVFIDEKGRKYPYKTPQLYHAGFLDVYPVSENGYTAFYNKRGRLVFKTKKKIGGKYSEGMIKVDSLFDLIGTKSGFIDTTGRLVIPYKFKTSGSNLSDFHDGLALYRPLNTEDAWYIYINKKGEDEIKVKPTDEMKDISFHGGSSGEFFKGFAYVNVNRRPGYLRKDKEVFLLEPIMKTSNPKFTSNYVDFSLSDYTRAGSFDHRRDIYLIFEATMTYKVDRQMTTGGFGTPKTITKAMSERATGLGLVSVLGEILLAPVFKDVGFVDIISGLTRATYQDNQNKTLTTGYVDESGIFRIVTSAKTL